MASQNLIQIPVVCQRTSGVIIFWCLILHLFPLSFPVVFMNYDVVSLKAAGLVEMVLPIGKYLGMGKPSGFSPYSVMLFFELTLANDKI